ncbi:stage 0 sporulation family protein [Aureivirga sp. CE67]|uniref:PSP1 domain-containing protein n=1 Tax=Aureivirga sp. CE67 TaxID=1788983 RepID=UPI0018CB6577|nr:regulatory iron-sulfur-containing complex subunit RicT [Aureivirga sp. CE67]
MGCSSCSTNSGGVPKGCKSNGSCATGNCSSEKLQVFDWLSNMTLPTGQKPFDIVEIRFKNGRKGFYKNTLKSPVTMGDVLAVEGNPGFDVGTVSLAGELVRVQMRKKNVAIDGEEVKTIIRKASQKDIDTWQYARGREIETQRKGREIIGKLGLKMKLSDVEFQGDGNKATFYYTADDRVDFRQLIRDFASEFSIRIEMKQVGLRQEAARLGGIGSCGRELCCSTWMTDFRKVNTAAARYQQLSLNPQKLAGQCGKLKCCLNYELDSYLDALGDFPKQDVVLNTERGEAVFIKMDIFKKLLWYTYKEDRSKWYKLELDQVKEIIELNEEGEPGLALDEYEEKGVEELEKVDFEKVVGQDSLTRFDAPKKRRRKKPSRNRKKPASNNNQRTNGNSEQNSKKETSGNNNNRKNGNQNRNQNRKTEAKSENGNKPVNKQNGSGNRNRKNQQNGGAKKQNDANKQHNKNGAENKVVKKNPNQKNPNQKNPNQKNPNQKNANPKNNQQQKQQVNKNSQNKNTQNKERNEKQKPNPKQAKAKNPSSNNPKGPANNRNNKKPIPKNTKQKPNPNPNSKVENGNHKGNSAAKKRPNRNNNKRRKPNTPKDTNKDA